MSMIAACMLCYGEACISVTELIDTDTDIRKNNVHVLTQAMNVYCKLLAGSRNQLIVG